MNSAVSANNGRQPWAPTVGAGKAIGASCDTLLSRKSYAQNHHPRRQLDGAATLDRHRVAGIGWPPPHPGSPPGFDDGAVALRFRSEEHTPELPPPCKLVYRLLPEKKKNNYELT